MVRAPLYSLCALLCCAVCGRISRFKCEVVINVASKKSTEYICSADASMERAGTCHWRWFQLNPGHPRPPTTTTSSYSYRYIPTYLVHTTPILGIAKDSHGAGLQDLHRRLNMVLRMSRFLFDLFAFLCPSWGDLIKHFTKATPPHAQSIHSLPWANTIKLL